MNGIGNNLANKYFVSTSRSLEYVEIYDLTESCNLVPVFKCSAFRHSIQEDELSVWVDSRP
jgi:hypothetical protein